MSRYGEIVNERKTPQSEKARSDQALNQAGGYVFEVGPWKQMERFLILGQIGATYYASERKVVRENAEVIKKCIAEDGARAVKLIVDVSDNGRAPKNDPAIFALALAASTENVETRKLALAALPRVCRTGTHLFNFAADVGGFRRWGRGLRTAIGKWYSEKNPDRLAMQAIKYQQRNGWSHRDLLRLAHPVPGSPQTEATFRWMIGGTAALEKEGKRNKPLPHAALPSILVAFDAVHAAKDVKEVVRLIREHELPREAVPTEWLKEPAVWEALLPHMGLTAMIRNLGKMTSIGLAKPMGATTKLIAAALTNQSRITTERVHPMQYLLAFGVYHQGHGEKGKLTWQPARELLEALDSGFYQAFANVQPTGKNTLIAMDVSGSMDGGVVAGAPGITPRTAAAAMAMVTARAEKNWHMIAFTSSGGGYGGRWDSTGRNGVTAVDIGTNDRLDAVCQKFARLPMGGTDCALPMLHAAGENLEVDVFQVFTDNETWHGGIHPYQALQAYRAKSGRPAKLAVVGLTATNFTIADPRDAGMLDFCGFDTHAPALMAQFVRGEV